MLGIMNICYRIADMLSPYLTGRGPVFVQAGTLRNGESRCMPRIGSPPDPVRR